MLKKYYTFSAYSMDEITCFSTQEIFYRLLCEKVIEKRATAIAKLAETMEPMDYLILIMMESRVLQYVAGSMKMIKT